ncbi:MAG: hypothetical protein CL840_07570 [Crocinitomicaceae bacterium]|nr:hypothetical protein [Crocinitomicaceae bacterium]|tara:strand:- start:21252 stop:22379 length:1128 start_codon:yes stop_codon:yes gene_type:complete
MKLVERICFPTDFGMSSEVAFKSVISIAKKFGSEVSLVHVMPESILRDKIQRLVEDKMLKYLGLLERQNIKCSSEILQGDHIDLLLSFAERQKANLIVLGAGHVGKEKFKLGTNSLKIIRDSSVPVWVIEKEGVVNPQRVLCPIDFSQESKLALDSAIHLCRRFDSKLYVLHVIKGIDKEYIEMGADADLEQAEMIRTLELEFDESIKDVDFSGISWEKVVRLGDPPNVILDVVKEQHVDLLMMGSTGKGAIKRFFLGSIAERVARQVPCSFIINKNGGLIQLKLDKEITDIEAIYEEGVELAKQGFVQEAILEWKRCIRKNELYLKAWSAIVKAYKNIGDKDNAERFNESRERIQKVLWDQQVEADLRRKLYRF